MSAIKAQLLADDDGRHRLGRLIEQNDILQGGKEFLRLSWGSRSRGAAQVQLGGGSKTDRRVE